MAGLDVMPRLDKAHQSVLRVMPPDFLDLSDIPKMRQKFIDAMAKIARPPRPEGLEVTDHRPSHDVMVRTYRPAGLETPAPALYWIHGGGLVMGTVEMDDDYCAGLAHRLGILVASVEYRLSPDFPYPIPLEDCYTGLRWLHDNATTLGVDTARIGIGGASGGGALCAGLGLLARDRAQVPVCYQFLVFPMIDDRNETPMSHAILDPRLWNRTANLIGWNSYLEGRAGAPDIPIYAAAAAPPSRSSPGSRRPTSTWATSTCSSTRTSNTPGASVSPACRSNCTSTPAPSTGPTTPCRGPTCPAAGRPTNAPRCIGRSTAESSTGSPHAATRSPQRTRHPSSRKATTMSIVEQPAKAIYLANRHPRLTREEFRERWMTHSRVGELLAGGPQPIAGLRYCLTVDPTDLLPGASNEHDGVGLLPLRSVVSIPTAHAVLTRNDVAFADELRTFERAVEDVTVYAASELVVEGPETDVVVFHYARRREAVDPSSTCGRPNAKPTTKPSSKPVCAAGCATSPSARRRAASATTR